MTKKVVDPIPPSSFIEEFVDCPENYRSIIDRLYNLGSEGSDKRREDLRYEKSPKELEVLFVFHYCNIAAESFG